MFFDADSACYIPGKEDGRLWKKGIFLNSFVRAFSSQRSAEIAISMRKMRGKLDDLTKEFKKGGYVTKICLVIRVI